MPTSLFLVVEIFEHVANWWKQYSEELSDISGVGSSRAIDGASELSDEVQPIHRAVDGDLRVRQSETCLHSASFYFIDE